jgi:hypothetical protein
MNEKFIFKFFLVVYTILFVLSMKATKIPEERTPQSPVWPNIVANVFARKNPNRIAIKLTKVE